MKQPFHLNSNSDYIASLEYRVECKRDRERGVIVADGREFQITEDGRYWEGNNGFPSVDDYHMDLIVKLVDIQEI